MNSPNDETKVINILCKASRVIREGPMLWDDYIKLFLKRIETFTDEQWELLIHQIRDVKTEDVTYPSIDIDEYYNIGLQDAIYTLRHIVIIRTLRFEGTSITE